MFGYVRPLRGELKVKDEEWYRAAYCGLCHTLSRRCGWAARYVLNYDFTFLALLLEESPGQTCQRRCPAHPLRKRACGCTSPAMELAAEESVILTYYKLTDSIRDEKGWKAIVARLGRLFLRRAYRRAAKSQPPFEENVAACLGELEELEAAQSPSLDRTADTFARLLAGASPQTGDARRDRPLRELLYHLGRWIYLLDAFDDRAEDEKAGRYNPVSARFSGKVDEDYLRTTLNHSLSLAQSAFQLLETVQRRELLENILYLGLPAVQGQVFAGTWGKKTRSMSQ